MPKGIFIVGTDTGVGKTVVSAGLLALLRMNGIKACYFKPVLSGAGEDGGRLVPYDAVFVKKASGLCEDESSIVPYAFRTPVSPHLASQIEDVRVDAGVIKESLERLKTKYEIIVAEGCGGLAVPLTAYGYMLYDLIKELGFCCLVVARASLGTINHTLLTVRCARDLGIKVKGIVVNGYKGGFCEEDNVKTIERLTSVPVTAVIPAISGVDTETLRCEGIREVFEKNVDLGRIIELMEAV